MYTFPEPSSASREMAVGPLFIVYLWQGPEGSGKIRTYFPSAKKKEKKGNRNRGHLV